MQEFAGVLFSGTEVLPLFKIGKEAGGEGGGCRLADGLLDSSGIEVDGRREDRVGAASSPSDEAGLSD